MTSIDFSKPLFGNKHTSLQKLLAKANKTTERAIKCGKQMCELRRRPYYYAYWKDPESKKLKKRYVGDYMPKNKESNDNYML
jgi:hypothetical protein